MQPPLNVVGRVVARLRAQRQWTQDHLVARLQVIGCDVTRDILANIETGRSVATDVHIEAFATAFEIPVHNLFPAQRLFTRRPGGVVPGIRCFQPRHRRNRRPAIRRRLRSSGDA